MTSFPDHSKPFVDIDSEHPDWIQLSKKFYDDRYYKQVFTDKSHDNYKSYKWLLAYRFKNNKGLVKTAYLDDVFEKLYTPKQGSIEDVHDYYYVFIKILKEYIKSITVHRYDKCREFYGDISYFYFTHYHFNSIASIRRSEVVSIYYYIFDRFNKFIDDQPIPYYKPLKKLYKSEFAHNEAIEAAKRKKWVEQNQKLISYQASVVHWLENKKSKGRPRKFETYHPDLYGF